MQVMVLAVVIGTLLMVIKFGAYLLTGSAGILSDALESIINVAASGFALYSVYLSTQPPDANHPYGHGKVEYFSAGFEGGLIVLAAGAIFIQAVPRFFDPRPLAHLGWGMLLLLAATILNLALAYVLLRTGKRFHSMALTADGKHLLTDVITSVGVIIGLILVRWTGLLWLDPLVACLVAGNILYSGSKLLRESTGRLMDEAEPELLERIVQVLNTHRQPEWIHVHNLRARRYGPDVHVDLHVIFPRWYDLNQIHQAIKEIEKVLQKKLGPGAEIIVHPDPCTDPWCPICVLPECEQRSAFPDNPAFVQFSLQEARQIPE
ncbi:MAG: cation diffusion facilitator family transporter [Desulfovermiculus sp.]|nr:cation diffusion facilitator family transporter [Desulfovermiculus sp.]